VAKLFKAKTDLERRQRTSHSDGLPRNVGPDAMEQSGTSNGQDAKRQASPPASGASKSPKKRRKVNHGTSPVPATWRTILETFC
jgi:hypothetical protein